MAKQLSFFPEVSPVEFVDMKPEDRLLRHGVGAMSNAELVAVFLSPQKGDRLRRAEAILQGAQESADGFLEMFGSCVREKLGEYAVQTQVALTPTEVARIQAVVELALRLNRAKKGPKEVVRSPEDGYKLLERMRFLDKEEFRVVALNTKNQVLSIETISIGSLSSSIVHPRETFKPLLLKSAAACLLAHNHPSGDPTPSREDREITRRLVEAGRIMGIEVLDHIVIGDGRYSSLKELGYI
ncbi:DNA repair protein RadC [Heliobacterium undosum]|uniref:DNA repair protein RadC n=1 Tax=Heliomicrobium undosum TaxID=121734 RepID=A0A845L9V7_9FIRM|nr:DNA repair protein RadC [Heliomicrobium undosum]MZP31410.1 DNA repair protein RadC [Heliomicrobium undosum]